MPRIRCYFEGCVYLAGGFCRALEVELDAGEGCLTFAQMEDLPLDDEEWAELFDEDEDFFDKDDDGYDPSEWN